MARKPTDTVALTLRVREDLRRRLEKEAKKHDHSLNNEMVRRLEETFQPQRDALINLIAGNDSNALAMRMIAEAMMLAQTLQWQSGKSEGWTEKDTANMIRGAVHHILTKWGDIPDDLIGDEGWPLARFILDRHRIDEINKAKRLAAMTPEETQKYEERERRLEEEAEDAGHAYVEELHQQLRAEGEDI
jgi:hypothetical protein